MKFYEVARVGAIKSSLILRTEVPWMVGITAGQ
jgi:hypothetical protein